MAVAITALGAMTLLSGCGEDDQFAVSFAWGPVGYVPAFWTAPTAIVGATGGGGGQTAAGGAGGGVSVGSVGGNQVSTGMAVQ
jgi:hypothetical protein